MMVKSGGIKWAKNVAIEIQPLGTGDLKTLCNNDRLIDCLFA